MRYGFVASGVYRKLKLLVRYIVQNLKDLLVDIAVHIITLQHVTHTTCQQDPD